ncbi:hypothetical protein FACS1894184_12600 [Clostridia bacterium]|nr:hypothetical protein FACS1894184_12600 [Clostridia bacterium]
MPGDDAAPDQAKLRFVSTIGSESVTVVGAPSGTAATRRIMFEAVSPLYRSKESIAQTANLLYVPTAGRYE